MSNQELLIRKCDLLVMKWKIKNGRAECDPRVKPAAMDWLDGEIAAIEKALAG